MLMGEEKTLAFVCTFEAGDAADPRESDNRRMIHPLNCTVECNYQLMVPKYESHGLSLDCRELAAGEKIRRNCDVYIHRMIELILTSKFVYSG
jgi:hypothetical protein